MKRVRESDDRCVSAIRQAIKRRQCRSYDNDDEVLFEDDTVSIWFVRFVPGLHVPPHDHQTTATIGVYEGAEDNSLLPARGRERLVHKSTQTRWLQAR